MNTPKYITVVDNLLKGRLGELYDEMVALDLRDFKGDKDKERNRRYREVFLHKIGLRYIRDTVMSYEVVNPRAWLFYSMQSAINYREMSNVELAHVRDVTKSLYI